MKCQLWRFNHECQIPRKEKTDAKGEDGRSTLLADIIRESQNQKGMEKET